MEIPSMNGKHYPIPVKNEIEKALIENDILFIDSSHIIRPQGDVLTQCLEILPILKPGVLIHFHDIFTPFDYLKDCYIHLTQYHKVFLNSHPSFLWGHNFSVAF